MPELRVLIGCTEKSDCIVEMRLYPGVTTMSPDLNPVINNRLAQIRKWCRTPRHIKARNAQIAKHPKCSRCGRPATCILHESPGDYEQGYDHYIGLIERGERPTGCAACNRAERAGKRPCPSCVEKYKRDPEAPIHYITQDQETCRYCEPGYDKEKAKFRHEHKNRIKARINKRIYRSLHPAKEVRDGRWVEKKREAMV